MVSLHDFLVHRIVFVFGPSHDHIDELVKLGIGLRIEVFGENGIGRSV